MSESRLCFPRAVLFDFDGIIVDTERLHYDAFQAALAPEGLSYGWATYEQDYMGFDDRDAFACTFREAGRALSAALLQQLIRSKSEIFIKLAAEGDLPPYPGLLELIELLQAKKVALALCSGALRSDIEPILSKLGLAECFELMVTADEVAKSKPDPESYLKAWRGLSEKTGLALEETSRIWAIEDTPEGLRSARGAGLIGIGIAHTHSLEALAEADLRKSTFSELNLWLNSHAE